MIQVCMNRETCYEYIFICRVPGCLFPHRDMSEGHVSDDSHCARRITRKKVRRHKYEDKYVHVYYMNRNLKKEVFDSRDKNCLKN